MDFLQNQNKKRRVLLVEDNPADIRLTKEAFSESKSDIILDVVTDGEEALDFLFKRNKHNAAEKPDFILLDLNLPKKSGSEVLAEIKNNPILKKIPTIVLTTSDANHDITRAYENHANCYLIKPVDFDEFAELIRLIDAFWLRTVKTAKD